MTARLRTFGYAALPRRRRATALLSALAAVLASAAANGHAPTASPRAVQLAERCFAMPDSRVVGVDRICYYRCGATTVTAVAVKATELCPMFIDR